MTWRALSLEIAAEMGRLAGAAHGMPRDSYRTFCPRRRAAVRRAAYLDRRGRGKCAACNRQAVPGKSTCERHVAKNDPGRYARRRAAGLCGMCGEPSEKSKCDSCAQPSQYARRRAAGLCGTCGAPSLKSKCAACLATKNAWRRTKVERGEARSGGQMSNPRSAEVK